MPLVITETLHGCLYRHSVPSELRDIILTHYFPSVQANQDINVIDRTLLSLVSLSRSIPFIVWNNIVKIDRSLPFAPAYMEIQSNATEGNQLFFCIHLPVGDSEPSSIWEIRNKYLNFLTDLNAI